MPPAIIFSNARTNEKLDAVFLCDLGITPEDQEAALEDVRAQVGIEVVRAMRRAGHRGFFVPIRAENAELSLDQVEIIKSSSSIQRTAKKIPFSLLENML